MTTPVAEQEPPLVLHRCHWKPKLVGASVHEPVEAIKVLPAVAVPLIVGGAVFTGAAGDDGDGTGPSGGDGAPGVVGELPGGLAGLPGRDPGGDGFRFAALTQRRTLV